MTATSPFVPREDTAARSQSNGLVIPNGSTSGKVCSVCRKEKPITEFRRDGDGYRTPCIECHNTINRNWKTGNPYAQKLSRQEKWDKRSRAMDVLGGKCSECGNDDKRVLQIDHVNGGGRQHRLFGSGGAEKIVRQIINGTTDRDYQLLCCNCHQLKTFWTDRGIDNGPE